MQALLVGQSAYRRDSAQLPAARVENYYVEQAGTSSSGMAWIPRPGLKLWRAGNGPLRGIFREPGTLGGDVVAVVGETAYRIGADKTTTAIGSVSGSGRVSMAGSLAGVMIANGETLQYSTGGALADVTLPFSSPVSVVYASGYWLCVAGGTQKRYFTQDSEPTDWNALDFDSAAERTDNLVAVAAVGGRIWDIGQRSIEFRYPTGNSEAPFAPEVGRSYQRGCLSPGSVAAIDNSLIWVGEDRIVYRGGEVPEALSDAWLGERLGRVSADDIYAFPLTWDSHVFYCLTIGAEGTFLFDLRSGVWSQWVSYKADGIDRRWTAGLGCVGFDDLPLVGDVETGNLYQLDATAFTDDGQVLVGVVSMGLPIRGTRAVVSSLNVEMATGHALDVGLGSDPVVSLRTSRDGGFIWGGWREGSLGRAGEYNRRVRFNRLGQFIPPAFVAELRVSDPVPRRISGAYVQGEF